MRCWPSFLLGGWRLCHFSGFISTSHFLLYEMEMLHWSESKLHPASPGCFCLNQQWSQELS